MPDHRIVIVTLGDEAVEHMQESVEGLRRAGLEVTETLEFLGQVTGRCSAETRDTLRALPGVQSVEDSGTVTLAPPGSPVQ